MESSLLYCCFMMLSFSSSSGTFKIILKFWSDSIPRLRSGRMSLERRSFKINNDFRFQISSSLFLFEYSPEILRIVPCFSAYGVFFNI